MNPNKATARFPRLRQLAEMTDPPWQFTVLETGVVTATRTHLSFVEALWVIDERRAGMHCPPLPSAYGAPVPTRSFSGPLAEAVALLQRPVLVRTNDNSHM